jgi:hypothetical protein
VHNGVKDKSKFDYHLNVKEAKTPIETKIDQKYSLSQKNVAL